MARRPIRGSASNRETGKSCPFCRFPIKERDQVAICGECDTTHHEDCWDDHGGCAVPGCAAAPDSDRPGERGPSAGGTSHVPPKAGPSAKKVTIDPEPKPRRPRRQRVRPRRVEEPEPAAAPTSGGSNSRTQFWAAGAIVAFLAVIGVILISNNFGNTDPASGKSCEAGTGENGVPCFDNGELPNVPPNEMERQAGEFVRGWYKDITYTDWTTAWSKLSPRVREQINQRGGFQQWKEKMTGISKYLDPSRATVNITKPSYGEEGVLSVSVGNMPYRNPDDRCQERTGVTWVRWDPEGNRWFYEPGLDVTAQRKTDWKYQSSRVLTPRCG